MDVMRDVTATSESGETLSLEHGDCKRHDH